VGDADAWSGYARRTAEGGCPHVDIAVIGSVLENPTFRKGSEKWGTPWDE